ncbi:MAG: hypothetical protein WC713_04105 [Candidatus Methylomirabilota bacterium]
MNDCEEVNWLVMRYTDRDQEHEEEQLLALARSMLSPVDPQGKLTFDPTHNAHAFQKDAARIAGTDLAVGQLHPIRVFQYPRELLGTVTHKTYGIICGSRRWKAACLLNKMEGRLLIPTLDARVFILTKDEYDDDETQFRLMMMAFQENDQRKQMSIMDRCQRMRELEERYYELVDRKEAQRPGRRPPGTVRVPDQVLPPRKTGVKGASARSGNGSEGHGGDSMPARPDAFATYMHKQTGRPKTAIRQEVQIGRMLASSLFDVWHREQLSYGAVRALVPIPAKAQVDIVNRLLKQGKPITESQIRDAVMARRQQKQDEERGGTTPRHDPTEPPGAAEPGKALVPVNGTAAARQGVPIQTTCDHCEHCQVLFGDPANCRPFSAMVLAMQVATQVCCDLELRVRLTNPKAMQMIREPAASLATASDSLNQFLGDPQAFRTFSPLALGDPETAGALGP